MASVYITEFSDPRNTGELSGVVKQPPVAEQKVAITGSSTQSAAFNAATKTIRVHVDAICSLAIGGTNPTATVSTARYPADSVEYYDVNPGDKLATIVNT